MYLYFVISFQRLIISAVQCQISSFYLRTLCRFRQMGSVCFSLIDSFSWDAGWHQYEETKEHKAYASYIIYVLSGWISLRCWRVIGAGDATLCLFQLVELSLLPACKLLVLRRKTGITTRQTQLCIPRSQGSHCVSMSEAVVHWALWMCW